MIHFECDYTEGAHPKILDALVRTNLEQTAGYGVDEYCRRAAARICSACQSPEAQVHFLTGGTQTNLTVIACALKPWQGVIAADSGHIQVHETGAVEATGHKVLTIQGKEGKVTAEQIEAVCRAHETDGSAEHTVQPGMVYLSQPTELGTLYRKAELAAISRVAREHGLFLFIDGARLGYGLAAPDNDVTLGDLAELTDVFTIGGTKVGALFGEAVVITHPALQRDFRYSIKQRGGMLAKGRLLGLQFDVLFTDGLYEEISAHAIAQAERIRAALAEKGIPCLAANRTNQIFPVFKDAQLSRLSENYSFCFQEKTDETHTAVRICTSWATREEAVTALITEIRALS